MGILPMKSQGHPPPSRGAGFGPVFAGETPVVLMGARAHATRPFQH